jgi:hypothetical protein
MAEIISFILWANAFGLLNLILAMICWWVYDTSPVKNPFNAFLTFANLAFFFVLLTFFFLGI